MARAAGDDMNGRRGVGSVRGEARQRRRTALFEAQADQRFRECHRGAAAAGDEWYPLSPLRTAIAQAQESQQTVEAAVLAQARERARDLTTEKLRSMMGRRQHDRLRDAIAEAEATTAAAGNERAAVSTPGSACTGGVWPPRTTATIHWPRTGVATLHALISVQTTLQNTNN